MDLDIDISFKLTEKISAIEYDKDKQVDFIIGDETAYMSIDGKRVGEISTEKLNEFAKTLEKVTKLVLKIDWEE